MPSETFLRLPMEKQRKILMAAVHEFSQHPYGEATLTPIIREAGISRGAFYLYFADKTELFMHLLDLCRETVKEQLQQGLTACRGNIFDLPTYWETEAREKWLEWQKAICHFSQMFKTNHAMIGELLTPAVHQEMFLLLLPFIAPECLSVQGEEERQMALEFLIACILRCVIEIACFEAEPMASLRQLKKRMLLLQRGLSPSLPE